MITAFHSNWTSPFFIQNNSNEYYIEDFEILTTILSALKWRQNIGSIKMVTDKTGAAYYKSIGIESIWDLGIDAVLDDIKKDDFNNQIYWAAGKIYSLQKQTSPIAMIDTDFIVWEDISKYLSDYKLATIHKEELNKYVYPGKDYFNMAGVYEFDSSWDWTVLPCNTAFAYINDNKFKEYYTKTSIDFIKNSIPDDNKITNMVFAEQRLFSICAEKMGVKIKELVPLNELLNGNQTMFTHIWGYKGQLRSDKNKRTDFCLKCIKRIIKEFPEYEKMLKQVKSLDIYF